MRKTTWKFKQGEAHANPDISGVFTKKTQTKQNKLKQKNPNKINSKTKPKKQRTNSEVQTPWGQTS